LSIVTSHFINSSGSVTTKDMIYLQVYAKCCRLLAIVLFSLAGVFIIQNIIFYF